MWNITVRQSPFKFSIYIIFTKTTESDIVCIGYTNLFHFLYNVTTCTANAYN